MEPPKFRTLLVRNFGGSHRRGLKLGTETSMLKTPGGGKHGSSVSKMAARFKGQDCKRFRLTRPVHGGVTVPFACLLIGSSTNPRPGLPSPK